MVVFLAADLIVIFEASKPSIVSVPVAAEASTEVNFVVLVIESISRSEEPVMINEVAAEITNDSTPLAVTLLLHQCLIED